MALLIFNPNTVVARAHVGIATINFNAKGSISISKAAAGLLEITPGSKLSLLQDEDNLTDWYIAKDEANGFLVRGGSSGFKGLMFSNSQVARRVRESLGLEDGVSCTIRIGPDPELECEGLQCHPLITSAFLKTT